MVTRSLACRCRSIGKIRLSCLAESWPFEIALNGTFRVEAKGQSHGCCTPRKILLSGRAYDIVEIDRGRHQRAVYAGCLPGEIALFLDPSFLFL